MRDIEYIVQYCREHGVMCAAAESLTSGLVQHRFGAVSGVSDIRAGGVTAYSLEAKVSILGVDPEHAKQVNCVSERVAKEMARGVADLYGVRFGVSTTGYAGVWPAGGVDIPHAYMALYDSIAQRIIWSGHVEASPDISRLGMQELVVAELLGQWRRVLGG